VPSPFILVPPPALPPTDVAAILNLFYLQHHRGFIMVQNSSAYCVIALFPHVFVNSLRRDVINSRFSSPPFNCFTSFSPGTNPPLEDRRGKFSLSFPLPKCANRGVQRTALEHLQEARCFGNGVYPSLSSHHFLQAECKSTCPSCEDFRQGIGLCFSLEPKNASPLF